MNTKDKYGCHSKTQINGYWARSYYYVNPDFEVIQKAEWIEDRSYKECKYDCRYTDPKCSGCSSE